MSGAMHGLIPHAVALLLTPILACVYFLRCILRDCIGIVVSQFSSVCVCMCVCVCVCVCVSMGVLHVYDCCVYDLRSPLLKCKCGDLETE